MVGERIKRRMRTSDFLDREPVWRRLEDRINADGRATNLRNRPGKALTQGVPRLKNRNIGGGIAIGMVEAGIGVVLEDTVGVPFGGSSDVTSVRPNENGDGAIYTVNVNAPTENMAKARSFIDASTGFTSILTDQLNVRNVEVLKSRVARDTYQIELLIQD